MTWTPDQIKTFEAQYRNAVVYGRLQRGEYKVQYLNLDEEQQAQLRARAYLEGWRAWKPGLGRIQEIVRCPYIKELAEAWHRGWREHDRRYSSNG